MNKFTLSFDDSTLEKEFFWWSFSRDYFIIKIFLGSLILVVQFPSIIISITRSDQQIATGWGSLMFISVIAIIFIKYRPQTYNILLSLFHLLIMFVNIYYLKIESNDIEQRYGSHILFVYAAAHGTSHSTIVMLGTNFLMNSLSMMIAYSVYSFTFLEKGFTTFHLFLVFIATFTIFGKYMRDRSQREMFLMRERENRWLNIMKKVLPSNIVLVSYNEKLDKISLDLVNQNAKNAFKFQNDQSFSEFSRKMQLEKYTNFEMTLSNSNTEKFINIDLTNPNNQSLQQHVSARFREMAKEKKSKPLVLQNLKQINNRLTNTEFLEKVDQSNSLSNYSKQVVTQNQQIYGNNPSNFFPGSEQKNESKEQTNRSPNKPSISLKKNQVSGDEKQSQKYKSQTSSLSAKKKKQGGNQVDRENLQIEIFIGLFRSSEDQQLKRYRIKIIHYNVGQYYCLIVIEEESDEEKIQFLKKVNKSSEQVVQHFVDNIGRHIYRITEQLRNQQLKELIYKKSPQFLKTVKYESSIIYNSIYNIRSHFQWAHQKIKPKYEKFSIQGVLDDIYDTFQGNPKVQDNRIKLFISKGILDQDEVEENFCQYLHSDISLIKQLLYSLLLNSFDYTDKGYIVLKLTEIQGENDLSSIIKLEVSDSGKGFEGYIDKVNALINVQNPQFSDYYYGSICFGLKNSQKIVRALGPYSKLFIFTRNGKGSRICFYLYQNMNVFSQSNNHIQFSNPKFEADLKIIKELQRAQQQETKDKNTNQEESSFLGFENVTEINIKELEEDTTFNLNDAKSYNRYKSEQKLNIPTTKVSSSTSQQSKHLILPSPNKKFFHTINQNRPTESLDLGNPSYQQQSLKNSCNTNYSVSNTVIVNKYNQSDVDQGKRHLSFQEDYHNLKKDRVSIFKKNSIFDHLNNIAFSSNTVQNISTNNYQTHAGGLSPQNSVSTNQHQFDYSLFIDKIQEESRRKSLNQVNPIKFNSLSVLECGSKPKIQSESLNYINTHI